MGKKHNSELKPLDELFCHAKEYKKSRNFKELFEFMAKFPKIAPYNVMLMHVQKPNCIFVAKAKQWIMDFGRRIKPNARPLVVLRPFGPVDFLYDLSDTEGDDSLLPNDISVKFNNATGNIDPFYFKNLIENLPCDGIKFYEKDMASTDGGYIQTNNYGYTQYHGKDVKLKIFYDMVINSNQNMESKFSTILHELAHLYCGHLGTYAGAHWPDRTKEVRASVYTDFHTLRSFEALREFEAESTAWLVCERMNIHNSAAEYLSTYLSKNDEIPPISLEAVIKSVDKIENMIKQLKQPNKKLIVEEIKSQEGKDGF